MQIWQAIVLGAVQGFCEFLPVSSSGHLILMQKILGIQNGNLFYSVMLHLGTLIPVLIVLKSQIFESIKKPKPHLIRLIIATIPAGVVGIAIKSLIDLDTFIANNFWLLGVMFLLTAIELFLVKCITKNKERCNLETSSKSALVMGLGQALAVLPGLSRSGTTIAFGSFCRLDREKNANFCFLMSIPIILSAIVLEGVSCIKSGSIGNISVVPLIFGVLSSCVTGYIAIKGMLKIIKKSNYTVFCIYLLILGVTTIIFG